MSGMRGGGDEGVEGAARIVPATEESWRRHTRILALVEQIREARERRRWPEPPPPAR